jgi:hypothetical protein
MMNLQRDAKETALCGLAILAVWYVTQLGGFGPALLHTTAAMPVHEPREVVLTADAGRADTPQTAAIGTGAVSIPDLVIAELNADVALAVEPEAATEVAAAPETAAPVENLMAFDAPIVLAALPNSSSVPAPESPLGEVAIDELSESAPEDVKQAVTRLEIVDECLDANVCVDQYLWALYQRTLKQDTIKVSERRKVSVKRKGKMVTVTKTFSKRVNQDFTWKDPDAAERVGMSMMDYVIGGMDRSFKTKLFHALYAAEQAGLSPGITSGFRDDYRQSIASGMKAATGRSFHGGSARGGYGHGLAVDIVSVDGATRAKRWVSTEALWKWVDANGKEYGVGRPYLAKDPPHVGPINGAEYASKRGMKTRLAAANIKKRSSLTAQASAAKTVGAAKTASAAKTVKKPNTAQAVTPARDTKPAAVSNRPRMAMATAGRG